MIFRNRKKVEILKELSKEKLPELKDKSFPNAKDQLNIRKRLW